MLLLGCRELVGFGVGEGVEEVHAHGAFLFDDEPLVDAVVVEIVVARLEHFDKLVV